MPVIPGIGVGLSPLLQWIILPLLLVWFVRRQLAGAQAPIRDSKGTDFAGPRLRCIAARVSALVPARRESSCRALRQGLNDRTRLGSSGVFAFGDQVLQRSLHALQVRKLALDLIEPLRRDATNRAPIGAVLQAQQLVDFFQRKTKLLGAFDEPNTTRQFGRIVPKCPAR